MFRLFNNIIRDTLKVRELESKGFFRLKWSKTNLTMFMAFMLGSFMAVYDFLKHGFNFEVFVVYMGMAIGLKGVSIFGKKITK